MKKTYLCESCGKVAAKYEARLTKKGKNVLVCQSCLKKLNDEPDTFSHPLDLDHQDGESSFQW
ncbi:hypothetical protein [Laceyella sacchari]|jgi:ribosome-binding protein aMBF1 (putative translation factor)|uniref:ClpX-type ZB domain-containing protein n=1 Tax=Laceyella sacchari TaxID=37482 RepID=A0ABY5TZU6_LACSH|nr:hypothetical protein [Laceyella sacchari]TCW37747.1 hypothetical protein EDC32_103413 [Laceyella sacchari]UWE02889.1 hypothetical protein NYR52_12220 [Laceyella sacchari]